MLDTHAVARSLTDARFTEAQADAITTAVRLWPRNMATTSTPTGSRRAVSVVRATEPAPDCPAGQSTPARADCGDPVGRLIGFMRRGAVSHACLFLFSPRSDYAGRC